MAESGILTGALETIASEITRLRQEQQALQSIVHSLRVTRAEEEAWLHANHQKYADMRVAMADMERRWAIISEKPTKAT
jgi:hypothetical protein